MAVVTLFFRTPAEPPAGVTFTEPPAATQADLVPADPPPPSPALPPPDTLTQAALTPEVLAAVTPTPEAARLRVMGYHAWWMQDQWQRYDFGMLDKLMFFSLPVNGDGSFQRTNGWPDQWQALIREAKRTRTPIVPTILTLDPAVFRALFSNDASRRTLVRNAVQAVVAAQADGLHIDLETFEPVSDAVKQNFTRFVRELRAALDQERPGAQISVFLPAFNHANAYDEAALGRLADLLLVQGYDMHWLTGPNAGPVAPIRGWNGANWETVIQRYLDLGVPRRKIIMTVPYFGYEWPTESDRPGAKTRGTGQAITYAPVPQQYLPDIRVSAKARSARFGVRRDPVSDSPYYTYRAADGWYQGWYEDAQSLRAKYAYAQRKRIGGIAVFLLGYDNGELDPVLRAMR